MLTALGRQLYLRHITYNLKHNKMWKTLGKTILPVIKEAVILTPENVLQQQLRTTFILKRRNKPFLHKAGERPKRLRNKHYIYDLVKDTNIERQPDLDVILKTYISGLGQAGDKVSVRPNYAYNNLLLPGLAVYATPENLEKYKDSSKIEEVVYSSPTAQRTIGCLSRACVSVNMNKDTPWTIQKWHVKASFRKSGYHVREDAIELPEKPIKGPNMDLECKEFYVTVTVNNTEKVKVRCILHHWSTDITERLPHERDFWKRRNDPIFTEHEETLASLPSTLKATGTATSNT